LFDYKRFRLHTRPNNKLVIKLQGLLDEILQERISLFSRAFPIKVTHDFSGCHLQDSIIQIDPELIPFKTHSLDLALSSGPLMFTNDIPGVLKQWYAALKPDGVFMAAFFGEESLIELKECFFKTEEKLQTPHELHFFPTIATKDAGLLVQRAGFHSPTADKTRLTLHAKNLTDLLHTLKALGGNILHERSRSSISKKFLNTVESEYHKSYSDESGLRVTVDIVCMTGWAIERCANELINQQTPKIGYL
ncbi:MAG: methyltransferase domain-containing protein, partial [Alphaproteobacteria bacterium]